MTQQKIVNVFRSIVKGPDTLNCKKLRVVSAFRVKKWGGGGFDVGLVTKNSVPGRYIAAHMPPLLCTDTGRMKRKIIGLKIGGRLPPIIKDVEAEKDVYVQCTL